MAELYKAMPNSPVTTLTSQISATQDIIPVTDLSKLPDAPNLATIGFGEKSETIRYTSKSNGALRGVTRGFEGTAQKWPAGTEVARFFTAYDYNEVIENMVWFAEVEEW